MALVEPTYYSPRPQDRPNWTAGQEKMIASDYPFELNQETPEQFITRTYLQFLWLPESLMPLQLLVPSIRRLAPIPLSSSSSPHPLHSLLDLLLQTARTVSNKYHVELTQILMDGGGAGEMEETVMWYALHHERSLRSDNTENHEPWTDEKWRQSWLERLERREIQIQILFYMTKLSLPGPVPNASPKKRKRSRKELVPITLSIEEQLESLMDKLSVLQLSEQLEMNRPKLNHNERDWAQIFCEDVVQATFKPQLPDLCSLLRSKVFPASPFSDTDTEPNSRSPSPASTEPNPGSRGPSPAPSIPASKLEPRSLARARSRSLSVSLAREQKERERSVSVGFGRKNILNREVSMSRVFKSKQKASQKTLEPVVESQTKGTTKPTEDEVILVEDTPQKPRASNKRPSLSTASTNNLFGHRSSQSLFSQASVTDDDEAWMLDSSPDVMLLHPGRRAGSSDDEYEAIVFHTPSKKPRHG